MKFPVGKDRVERTGVFERVQLPIVTTSRQALLRDQKPYDRYETFSRSDRYGKGSRRKQGGKESRYNSSFSRNNKRYAPYQKQQTQTWKAKEKMEKRQELEMISYEPYAHGMKSRKIDSPSPNRSADISMDDRSSRKKIASAIVTPSRQDRDENVTKRDRGTVRLLSLSPKEKE
ncbi:hypothetical protein Bca4012_090169 [Brassica carinata]